MIISYELYTEFIGGLMEVDYDGNFQKCFCNISWLLGFLAWMNSIIIKLINVN